MKNPTAVINGKTLGEGESASISLKPDSLTLTVRCIKIDKDSASILIEGEDQPRLLRLPH
jgi:hypothetical protein